MIDNQDNHSNREIEIIVAKTAGFCFGVKRAVNQVYEQIAAAEADSNKIYTYGPIIHNTEVVNDLSSKGVTICEDEDQLDHLEEGMVIIRSHGVSRAIMDKLEEKKNKNSDFSYIDMTCPFVTRIHDIVDKESIHKNIVIIGNAGHPEVEGIRGWARDRAVVIENTEDALAYQSPENRPVCVVAQTTFNYNKFQEFVEIFTKKGYDINVVNTICDATRKRQEEAAVIASKVDAMIVIGDKKSSNSKKLNEICQSYCKHTFFVQTVSDLTEILDNTTEQILLERKFKCIGITAGASTPNNIIEEVQKYVRRKF